MIETSGIHDLMPHRYPMSLVDRVLEAVPGERLTAVKAVTCNEPCYAYLGPAPPATWFRYPQMLLVESWGQAAGVLSTLAGPDVLAGKVMLLGGMTGVEFHASVYPGDVVEHQVVLARELTDTVIFTGSSLVAGEPVMTVSSAIMAFRPAGQLRPVG